MVDTKGSFKGRAWKFGDNVDTDVIIPARYLTMRDSMELAKHCMEDIDKSFAGKVKPGDIIVAGRNFGCGSSREHAPIAIKGSGVSLIVAESFARIFYRNAINTGLPIVSSKEIAIALNDGEEVEIDFEAGALIKVKGRERFELVGVSEFLLDLVEAGGLIQYVRKRLD